MQVGANNFANSSPKFFFLNSNANLFIFYLTSVTRLLHDKDIKKYFTF